MSKYLSKSDFKIAQSCPTKLYYKKNGYPTTLEDNEYLLQLADGGYMVGKMAQLLYNGTDLSDVDNLAEAETKTKDLLLNDYIVIFEAAIIDKNRAIRIDILEKQGNVLRLIEVKSKSFDSQEYRETKAAGRKYFEKTEWTEYIDDVAFQKLVLKEHSPNLKIEAFLFLPDKAKTTPIEGLADWFQIVKTEVIGQTRFRKTDVAFIGELTQLRSGHILELVNVDEYVEKRLKNIGDVSLEYIESIQTNQKIQTPIQTSCAKCEYLSTNLQFSKSGFQECWKELADVKPHLLQMIQLGNFNRSKEKPIDKLILEGKVGLQDVPIDIVKDKYNNRAYYQITSDQEFLLSEFTHSIENIEYPLHFIDFETSQMAIPYHAGMRPYEKVIFQWSCHTINEPSGKPVHKEWINLENRFPNFEFAKSLRETVGDAGSLMIWSLYENSMLKEVFNGLETYNHEDSGLKDWLRRTIMFSKGEKTRFVDLNELALKYYFHPFTGGKTSIKKTLPAVLLSCDPEIARKYLGEIQLFELDRDNRVIDPYSLLPKVMVDGISLDVANGTDAMMAYQEMMYGRSKSKIEMQNIYKTQLLHYCRLDTLAMIIIWEHWLKLAQEKQH